MSDTFDPGPGWREVVNVPMSDLRPGDYIADEQFVPEGAMRMFTVKRREVPVPPLPTEPGLYLDASGEVWIRFQQIGAGRPWQRSNDGLNDIGAASLPLQILEPRAVTAKAVLDRLLDCLDGSGVMMPGRFVPILMREFGVES